MTVSQRRMSIDMDREQKEVYLLVDVALTISRMPKQYRTGKPYEEALQDFGLFAKVTREPYGGEGFVLTVRDKRDSGGRYKDRPITVCVTANKCPSFFAAAQEMIVTKKHALTALVAEIKLCETVKHQRKILAGWAFRVISDSNQGKGSNETDKEFVARCNAHCQITEEFAKKFIKDLK